MTISLQIQDFGKLTALMNALGPSNRQRLNAVGAKELEKHVRYHISRYVSSRHGSAGRLGATPTGHYRKGMRGIAGHATAAGGEVVIPIAGISRAYHDIDITTPTANGKKALTIPKRGVAYGHTAQELERRGWTLFTNKRHPGILFGKKGKGKHAVVRALYSLVKKVHQRQDPSLLPSREQCASIVSKAMTANINRRLANAH